MEPISTSGYPIKERKRAAQKLPFESWISLLLHFATWMLWALYIRARTAEVITASAITVTIHTWVHWFVLAAEAALLIPEAIIALELSVSLLPSQIKLNIPSYQLLDDFAPRVDVYITTCGENVDIIMKTAIAAASQSYPSNAYRVFILDDGKSAELNKAVQAYNKERSGCDGFQKIYYLSRKKQPGVPHHYKSGNLRYGIETTMHMGAGSEYIAAVDADVIVERNWLSMVVPHLIKRPELALVNPPQLSCNLPSGDQLGQDSHVFHYVLDRVRNRFGCSQCHGSGYVMRRTALESIGGWPQVNVGEDIMCSFLLTGKGWKTMYLQDELQYGLAPATIDAYMMQRQRWTDGTILLTRMANFYLPGLCQIAGLTPIPRLFSFLHALKMYSTLPAAIAMLALPILLLLQTALNTEPQLSAPQQSHSQAIFIAVWLVSKLYALRIYSPIGRGNLTNMNNNRIWTTPLNGICVLRSLLPIHKIKFTVSGAFRSQANERSAARRQTLPRRLLSRSILLYGAYTALATITLVKYLVFNIGSGFTPDARDQPKLSGAILRLLTIGIATSVPVRYMINPPTVPERERLIIKDEYGVHRAKNKGWVKRERPWVNMQDILELAVVVLCAW